MKNTIAITCQNRKEVSGHAGMCRNFFVYTVDSDRVISKKILELTKEESLHHVLHNGNMEIVNHPIFNVNILLTGGIGMGAITKLKTKNVASYIIEEKNPDTAVSNLLKGELKAYMPDDNNLEGSCNCNGEEHQHHH